MAQYITGGPKRYDPRRAINNGLPKVEEEPVVKKQALPSYISPVQPSLPKYQVAAVPQLPKAKQDTTGMNWLQKYQAGDILGGTVGLAASTVQAPQSLYLNAVRAITDLARGNKLRYTPDLSYQEYRQSVGYDPLQKPMQEGGLKGVIAGTINLLGETATDPLSFVTGGEVSDFVAQRNLARPGSIEYTKGLQSGAMLPVANRKAVAQQTDTPNTNVTPAPEIAPRLSRAATTAPASEIAQPIKNVAQPQETAPSGLPSAPGIITQSMLDDIRRAKEIAGLDFENIGVRFENLQRRPGDVIYGASRHNPDRLDAREFPDFNSPEYLALPELDGISAWDLDSYVKRTKAGSPYFSDQNIYVVGSNYRGVHNDPDAGEILLREPTVIARISPSGSEFIPSRAPQPQVSAPTYIQVENPEYAVFMKRMEEKYGAKDMWSRMTDSEWNQFERLDANRYITLPAGGLDGNSFINPQAKDLSSQLKDAGQTSYRQMVSGQAPRSLPEAPVYGINTVGAAESAPRLTPDQLIDEFGALPKGEIPARDIQIPAATPEGKTSRFVRTAAEAPGVTDEAAKALRQETAAGTFSYVPTSNKAALQTASNIIESRGVEEATRKFIGVMDSGKRITKEDIALGEQLLLEASARGDTEAVIDITANLAVALTEAGKTVQAASMLKRMTPEGNLVYIQRTVNRMNEGLAKKGVQIKLPDANVADILSQTTPEGLAEAAGRAAAALAEQMPSNWVDKINAWRYLSMLGNTRTHVRNILGNMVFVPARKIKNIIGAGIEGAVRKIAPNAPLTPTKAILTPADKPLIEAARQIAESNKGVLQGATKFNAENAIMANRKIFDTEWLEKLRKFVTDSLEAEDWFFKREAYVDSLAQYMKANNLSPEFLQGTSRASQEAFQKAHNYAAQEALKATYQDANGLATLLNKLKRYNAATSVIGEAAIPFTKTPLNVLRRGVEYSPARLLDTLTRGIYNLKKGNIDAAEFIDQISSGLTGTGITALGMWLASLGVVNGGESGSTKETAFGRTTGYQEYSINLPDGSTYTIDWMAPAVMPMMVGVEIYNQLKAEGKVTAGSLSKAFDAMTNISEPMFNMSMLQGVNDLIKTYQQGTAASVGEVAGNLLASYGSQFIPTALGQIARTIDPVRRSTYAPADSPYTQWGEHFVRRQMAKIPGVSTKLEPSLDQWGREQQTAPGGPLARLAQNTLSPGYLRPNNADELDKELMRLNNAVGETSVLPGYAPKTIKYKDQTYTLSPEQLTKFQTTSGQTSRNILQGIIQHPLYSKATDEQKAAIVESVYKYAKEKAKAELIPDYKVDDEFKHAGAAAAAGIPAADYFYFKYVSGHMEAAKDANGNSIPGSKKAKIIQYLNKQQHLTAQQKEFLLRMAGYK